MHHKGASAPLNPLSGCVGSYCVFGMSLIVGSYCVFGMSSIVGRTPPIVARCSCFACCVVFSSVEDVHHSLCSPPFPNEDLKAQARLYHCGGEHTHYNIVFVCFILCCVFAR